MMPSSCGFLDLLNMTEVKEEESLSFFACVNRCVPIYGVMGSAFFFVYCDAIFACVNCSKSASKSPLQHCIVLK